VKAKTRFVRGRAGMKEEEEGGRGRGRRKRKETVLSDGYLIVEERKKTKKKNGHQGISCHI